MRIAVRMYIDGQMISEEHHTLGDGSMDMDRFAIMAEEHAETMLSTGKPGHVEIEFLDEPDQNQRFFRVGSDPRFMVMPLEVNPRDGSGDE